VRNLLLLFFLFQLLADPFLSAQNPYIQHYTTFDGLPSNSVRYIYQDSKKFIWFATDAGVSRYDGTSFTNYRNKDGLSSNDIIRIKEDSQGRIWFFNFNANVDFYYKDKIFNKATTPFLDSIKNKTFIIDFFQDKDQSIYFYNDVVEIFRLNRYNQVKKIDIDINLIKEKLKIEKRTYFLLRYLNKSPGNDFIFWTTGKIVKLDSLFKNPRIIFDSVEIWKVFPGRNNSAYLSAYGNGIFKVSDEFDVSPVFTPFKMPYGYPGIKSILEDANGNLWIITFDKGVYCMRDNHVIRHIDIKQGLSMIQDNENNLWISSLKDGVYRINPYLNTHRHYENSLFQNMGITSLYAKSGWGLWFTNSKSVYLFRNKDFYTLNYFIENSLFTQVFQMKNNTLIVGVEGSYSKAFDGISVDNVTKLIGFKTVTNSPEGFKKITINKNGDKITAISGSSVFLYNTYKFFHTNNEIKVGEHILNIFYNFTNELVINANKNYVCRNNKIIPFNELTRFDKKAITDHLVMNEYAELFNLEGDSIYLHTREWFFNLTAAFRSPIDLQVKKFISKGTELYLSTARNIYKCDNPLSIINNKPIHLQLLDINFRNIQDILVFNDSLYIASDDGLTIIPETLINKIETHIPIPYFQSILINDKETDISEGRLEVKSNHKITFNFSCINYSSTPILYSYKLEGLDKNWTTGTSRNVVYQNVSIGNYQFLLRARKSTAEWSEPVMCQVIVDATFWQHPLFYISNSLLIMVLVILIIIYRKNLQIKRRDLDHQLITLEQKALQSMMNPHFIFNSLGSIQNYLLQKRSGEAGLYLSQFARLIRQNLNAINSAYINLEEEIDRLKNYLDLEKLRMENKFDYSIDVDENLDAEEVGIPSMIIQPFVENAIWHGIAALEDAGQVNIRFKKQDERSIKVIIEDNGIGMRRSRAYSVKQEKHLHLGMEMTRKRLELLSRKFSIQTALNFSETYPGRTNPGTRVVLVLPSGY
jgi:two-component sensor histidine kinase